MTTATKERPILFNAEMVRAVLSGAKTQTRRPMKPQPTGDMVHGEFLGPSWDGDEPTARDRVIWHQRNDDEDEYDRYGPCPFGQPGDRLWVRETWKPTGLLAGAKPSETRACSHFAHKADPEQRPRDEFIRWRPSIHMPRWASRITLEVVGVWVERVQDITCADVEAEGMPADLARGFSEQYWFRDTWDSIYAKSGAGWDENPWVWCCEFKVVT